MKFGNLQEEELKARIGDAFFSAFDCDTIIGKIDFCVTQPLTRHNVTETAPIVSLLWAEAKRGTVADIYKPLVQLILTIGKARTFDTYLPPPFLAAFDAEKIAFLPYRKILPFLALNDFNWNVTPSDTSSREFGLLYSAVRDVLDRTAYVFQYDAHEKELREFIKQHLKVPSKPLPVIKNHRERKGSFFTPKIWVDLSQKYLADVLGENWQDEYYVWDCAAGTGNLLNGLTNKYNIWASTLDQQDVDVMKDRIKNGANLLESHVFQFDFLNDEFDCGKLPDDLLAVLKDPEKRKKLVIYINPPYAEATNARTPSGSGENRKHISNTTYIYQKARNSLGQAVKELFAQFLYRLCQEIPEAVIAHFATLKIVTNPNFAKFRNTFKPTFRGGFLVPANVFDNVVGEFPIGFYIWTPPHAQPTTTATLQVYNHYGDFLSNKNLYTSTLDTNLNAWRNHNWCDATPCIGYLQNQGADFQNQGTLCLCARTATRHSTFSPLSAPTLLIGAIYFAVRLCIPHTWQNHNDQFRYPDNGWKTDLIFQSNCLSFALFHIKNRITSRESSNHFIPFTEQEVDAKAHFESHFMTDFIAGKLNSQSTSKNNTLLSRQSFVPTKPLIFSAEATAVFDAGRELWRYYHTQPNANPNASYYDIREHFQGRNDKGKMNPKSEDKEYMRLLTNLKEAVETLRLKIVPKVYEYKFLME